MATYQCRGRERGICNHEAPQPWLGRCPICHGPYDCVKTGAGDGEGEDSRGKTFASFADTKDPPRILTGIPGFDRILGGGLVAGNTVLFSGEEGTGKSSLLVAACNNIATAKHPVLYASGEQTNENLAGIARRLGCFNPHVYPLGNTGNIIKIIELVEEKIAEGRKPALLVIDSINTAFMEDGKADVGSNEMGREVINYVTSAGKTLGISTIAVSHVNKENEIAGAKAVVHLVDTIIRLDRWFDYDDEGVETPVSKSLRCLSSAKNREGEEGLEEMFRMTEAGLVPYSTRLVLVPR